MPMRNDIYRTELLFQTRFQFLFNGDIMSHGKKKNLIWFLTLNSSLMHGTCSVRFSDSSETPPPPPPGALQKSLSSLQKLVQSTLQVSKGSLATVSVCVHTVASAHDRAPCRDLTSSTG